MNYPFHALTLNLIFNQMSIMRLKKWYKSRCFTRKLLSNLYLKFQLSFYAES